MAKTKISRDAALRRVAVIAGALVLETPERQGHARAAYVRYSRLRELSQALDAAGFNMADARKRFNAVKKAEKALEKKEKD